MLQRKEKALAHCWKSVFWLEEQDVYSSFLAIDAEAAKTPTLLRCDVAKLSACI